MVIFIACLCKRDIVDDGDEEMFILESDKLNDTSLLFPFYNSKLYLIIILIIKV